jgi:transcriptional regulator of arginine metabolism
MRRARQRAILRIVDSEIVRSQADLVAALEREGVPATQATVSRDIHHLGLIKVPYNGGGSRYVAPEPGSVAPPEPAHPLRAVADFVTGIEKGQSLLLIKTPSGHANAVAVELDKCRFEEVAGTIAGDDTILLILKREKDRPAMLRRLRDLLE